MVSIKTNLARVLGLAAIAWNSMACAQDLTGIKCVVNGDKNASENAAVEYRGAKVHLCCQGCVEKFKTDPAAFATKANHQLVLTGQFQQTACPISGRKLNADVKADLGGTQVGFCCKGCLKKVNDTTKLADKAELVFSDAAFEKGFEKSITEVDLTAARCLLQADKPVSVDAAVAHAEGKVFFCCQKCAAAFSADPDKYVTGANRQLVLTGQYQQTACPFSGGAISEDHVLDVNGVEVGFCCEKCVAKVTAAADDQARSELVFGKAAFEKGFKPNVVE